MTLARSIELAGRLRKDYDAPIVLFGYVNPLFSRGYARVCQEAAAAGIDAFLVVDLPFEESAELRTHLDRHGMDFVTLVAPTTPEARLERILKGARGFVYYIMVKGVTGVRTALTTDVSGHLERLKRHTDLPVVAGFGVSNGAQAREAVRQADGVVVGSALVKAAQEKRLAELVKELRQALDSGR
jgi:tryptophan synthase alpha chain